MKSNKPMPLSDEARKQHEELVQSYIAALPDRLAEIKAQWRKARRGQWRGGASRRKLYRIVHQLAGSGTVFGFPEITEQARRAATLLSEMSEETGAASADWIGQLEPALEALCTVLADAAVAVSEKPQVTPAEQIPPVPRRGGASDVELVYLVEDDQSQANVLAQQLSVYGCRVEVFAAVNTFLAAAAMRPPQAVIMDISFPGSPTAGIDAARKMNQGLANPVPVLFLSVLGDLQLRIDALQAGGTAYFIKPVNAGDLADRLDELLGTEVVDPYRILIVDDDRELANLYQQTLKDAGMEAEVINDPLQVMESLIDMRPELLLVDFTMPGCTGLDLAAALRQEDSYAHLPMVFVSAETDPRKRLACIGIGADDFLTKPVALDYLANLVAARVRRGRQLQHMIARDSLTGLLNHHAFMERFEDVLATAGRGQVEKLALAMIDLDWFKSINDRYGHPAGDVALKNVARLLTRRLRSTDIIGRYGGEEFAVVLIESDTEAACLRLDRIREELAQIPNPVAERTFYITFSAGVVGYDRSLASGAPPPGANELIRAADRALYHAKRNGGNQVRFEQVLPDEQASSHSTEP